MDEHEKLLHNAEKSNIQGQEKIVVGITSALFGLLLTINGKIPLDNECLTLWLKILIISNGIALFSSLMSYLPAHFATKNLLEKKESNYWYIATQFLNCISLVATLITIVVLVIVLCYIF